MWRNILIGFGIVLVTGPLLTAQAATTLPPGFSEWTLASEPGGSPTAMDFAPDGRLFVLDQGGSVWVIKNGVTLSTPFVSLPVNSSGERGLLGIAFDPNFASNHFVYLYHTTATNPLHNRISRFTANGDVAAPGSEQVIFDLPNLSSATNHNGGSIHFGQDGKLYVGVGENANGANSQSLNTTLGKMLRINPDGTIPTDNPFYGSTTGSNRAIWAMGLRNPFTFGVDRTNGTIFIDDVGQNTWEEINQGVAGANYGWPDTEGDFNQADFPNFTRPLFTYNHSTGDCAILGGTFYDPVTVQFPSSYVGEYFFTDLCGGWIHIYDPVGHGVTTFGTNTAGSVVDEKVGSDGSLYYLSQNDSSVHVIQYTQGQPPFFSRQPVDLQVTAGASASFSCTSLDSGASIQWQRDDGSGFADIGGATSGTFTIGATTLSDSGAKFHCVATNGNGSRTSQDATLTVVTNQPPVPTIVTPSPTMLYRAGTTIGFSGTAIDPEDGVLPPSAFSWHLDYYHNGSPTTVATIAGVRSGKYRVPASANTAADDYYQVVLTVTDSTSNSSQITRNVLPQVSTLTIQTAPPGMTASFDGQSGATPFQETGVVGMPHTLSAPLHQNFNSTIWQFRGWKPHTTSTGMITIRSKDTPYNAVYAERQVLNGSFETGKGKGGTQPTNWQLLHRTSMDVRDCSTADTLTCSLHLTAGSVVKMALQNVGLSGLAGDSYTLDFSTKGLNSSPNGFSVNVIVFYRDRTHDIVSTNLTPGVSWTPSSLVVPTNKDYSAIQIQIVANTATIGEAWFDSFHLSLN